MGDNRMNVNISVVGVDGKKQKIDWWVNWSDRNPAKLYEAIVKMAEKAGLQIDYSEVYGGSHYYQDRHIEYLNDRIEELENKLKAT